MGSEISTDPLTSQSPRMNLAATSPEAMPIAPNKMRTEAGAAWCVNGGRAARIDLALVGEQPAGAWVLAYQGSAVRTLTDDEAQQIAAFIDSQPRPAYPFKDRDYLTDKVPADSVYYPKR